MSSVSSATGHAACCKIWSPICELPTVAASIDAAHTAFMAQNWASPPRLTQYYPNVAADLPSLHAGGIALGRCTNKPQALTLRILDQLAIALLFSAVIGADAVAACKTDPGHLFAVTNKMGLQPGTSSYVGDIGIVQAAALAAEVPFFVVPELPPRNSDGDGSYDLKSAGREERGDEDMSKPMES